MNSTNTKLTLHGGDEWRTLEERACESLESAREGGGVGKSRVEAEDADIFLTGALLGLNEPRCTINADDEAARDFWVKCTTVTSFFATQDPPQPSDNFMRRRI